MASTSTLTEFLDSQQELEKEAALALPFSFSHCTYPRGHIRQAVYLCITCASRRGICSSCSIACHTDHEQLELFPKRNFRCDCPTSALAQPCTLHKHPEAPNEENEYGQNFDRKFCRCGRPYDAKSERETMIQCLTCEVRSWILWPRPLPMHFSGLVSRILPQSAHSSVFPSSIPRDYGGREWRTTTGTRR
jgi:E3 ubiquitin-protein ligase UBR7